MNGSPDQTSTANALLRAFNRLRDLHSDMTLLQASFLMYVARSPGVSQRALYEALGSNDSVASRTLAILSDVGSRNTPGLGLINMRPNPQDRRERVVTLTPKGNRLMADLAEDIAIRR